MAARKLNPDYEKNLAIYNEIGIYAQIVFESVSCEIGTYKAEQIIKSISKAEMRFADDFSGDEEITVNVDNFRCSFHAGDIFHIMKKVATTYGIKNADRIMFTRTTTSAETVVKFDIPATAKDIDKFAAKDELRPTLNGVFVDTERKIIVAIDGYVMRVVAVPGMVVSDNAENGYILPVSLFKGGKGTIVISTNNTASKGVQTAEKIEGKFPDYATVIPSYFESQKIDFTGVWKEFAKAAKHVAKNAGYDEPVYISGTKGGNTLTITSKNSNWDKETSVTVTISSPLQMDFLVGVEGSRIAKIRQADALYLGRDSSRAIVFTADGVLTLVMPKMIDNGHVTFKEIGEARLAMEIAHITQTEIRGSENQVFAVGDRVRTKYGFGTVAELPGYNFGWGARKGYTIQLDSPRTEIIGGEEYPDYYPELMTVEMELADTAVVEAKTLTVKETSPQLTERDQSTLITAKSPQIKTSLYRRMYYKRSRLHVSRKIRTTKWDDYSHHSRFTLTRADNLPRPPTKNDSEVKSSTKYQKNTNMVRYKISMTINGHEKTSTMTDVPGTLCAITEAARHGARIGNVTIFKY